MQPWQTRQAQLGLAALTFGCAVTAALSGSPAGAGGTPEVASLSAGQRYRLFGTPLPLDRASAAELELLPGVGPALAGRIVEFRGEHGRFRSPGELEAVSGIGPGLRQRLTPHLEFDTAARSGIVE